MPNGRYRIYVCETCGDYAQFAGWCLDCGDRLSPLDCISIPKIVAQRDETTQAVPHLADFIRSYTDSLLA